jgi:hypothetical protein
MTEEKLESMNSYFRAVQYLRVGEFAAAPAGRAPATGFQPHWLSEAVRASFEPIMKALGQVRQQLAGVQDVVMARPGYKYPPDGKPLPGVTATMPG